MSSGDLRGEEAVATFAGGCFWCMQPPFDALEGKGVIKTVVGYTGGKVKNPTYEEVSSGETGHVEAIEVYYDPNKITYPELLQVYWRNVDPEAKNRQFCDQGEQYRSAIFYHDQEQEKEAIASKEALEKSGKVKVVHTEILPASPFYPAEDYHQDYYKKNPIRYKFYKTACGRDRRLKELWGKS